MFGSVATGVRVEALEAQSASEPAAFKLADDATQLLCGLAVLPMVSSVLSEEVGPELLCFARGCALSYSFYALWSPGS